MKREFTDQLRRSVSISVPPRRIVSLVPSQTELLFDLGLGGRVVGVTDFCTEPAAALANCVHIGGTKRFLFDRIDALSPDLIIGNREENYAEGITRLEQRYPVWMSDIFTLDDALDMIGAIGDVTGTAEQTLRMASEIRAAFASLTAPSEISAAYLIWKKPWMAAGAATFIDDMLRRAGFANVFADCERYPECTLEQLIARQPQVVMLSSEPFPFDASHVAELAKLMPRSRVVPVDAMPFSWYGSRPCVPTTTTL